eukprot:scaffold192343_cov44-Attheya_sp.AAC.1
MSVMHSRYYHMIHHNGCLMYQSHFLEGLAGISECAPGESGGTKGTESKTASSCIGKEGEHGRPAGGENLVRASQAPRHIFSRACVARVSAQYVPADSLLTNYGSSTGRYNQVLLRKNKGHTRVLYWITMPAARRVGQSPPYRSIVSTTTSTGSNCTAGRLPACSSLADRSRTKQHQVECSA